MIQIGSIVRSKFRRNEGEIGTVIGLDEYNVYQIRGFSSLVENGWRGKRGTFFSELYLEVVRVADNYILKGIYENLR